MNTRKKKGKKEEKKHMKGASVCPMPTEESKRKSEGR